MRVLLAASEAVPFVKSGGLADVLGALPPALAAEGVEPVLALPLYGAIDRKKHGLEPTGARVDVQLGWRRETATIWRGSLGPRVPVWFVEHPGFFGGKELYGRWDDGARFTFFSRVVGELLREPPEGGAFDLFHGHDWQTGLVPALLTV